MVDTESFSDNQNFEYLLDEDGQGTRELDAWLYNHIETDKGVWPPNDVTLSPKNYTTGDSIDPIWNLAKDYARENIYDGILYVSFNIKSELAESFLPTGYISDWRDNEQLAIAESLFKAYQVKGEE